MKKQFILSLVIVSVLILLPFNVSRAEDLSTKLKGRILLQVEEHGEAWYVNPANEKRYYMANGDEAYNIMRNLGVGITNKDLQKVKTDKTFAKKHNGKIFLQVEENGEAFYIDIDGNAHYLKNGAEAYNIMRDLGLGITNNDLAKIDLYEDNSSQDFSVLYKYFSKEEVAEWQGNDPTENLKTLKPAEQKEILETSFFKDILVENGYSVDEFLLILAKNGEDTASVTVELFQVLSPEYQAMVLENVSFDEQVQWISTLSVEKMELLDDFIQGKLESLNQQLIDIKANEEDNSMGHIFYTSSHWSAEQYYCDTDTAWKGLSKNYLESYSSIAELLKVYPYKTLNEPCK